MSMYPKQGVVYIFQTPIGMKIGLTTRPIRKRMRELEKEYEVRFIHAVMTHDVYDLERALHARFEEKRIFDAPSREMFALSLEDVRWVQSIQNFQRRPCYHFHTLTDLVRHSLAVYRQFVLS